MMLVISSIMIPHLVVLSPRSVSVTDSNADTFLLNTVCKSDMIQERDGHTHTHTT